MLPRPRTTSPCPSPPLPLPCWPSPPPHALHPPHPASQWLERDLRLVDRCSTPWVVLSMHRPMYVVYPHKSNRIVGDHLRWAVGVVFVWRGVGGV